MLSLPPDADRHTAFQAVRRFIDERGYPVADEDRERPWGGFFVIDEAEALRFLSEFFPADAAGKPAAGTRLSPKILLVAPGKRLSWQFHHRRSELWRVVAGSVGIAVSSNDEQPPPRTFGEGETISIPSQHRHRLVGLEAWGVVAEIWQHVDPEHPSTEDDIVRVDDDFGR